VRGNPIVVTNGLRCGHSTTLNLLTTVTLGGAQSFTVTNAAARLSLAGPALELAAHELTIGGNGQVEISTAISGTGGIVKNGTNVLLFQGLTANTYTGSTLINAGTLQLNKNGVTAIAGNLIIGDGSGGAAADIVALLLNHQIANTAAITIKSSGLLKLGNSVLEDIGSLTLTGGRVEAPFGAGELGLLGNVTSLASGQPAELSGNISFAASRTFTVADGGAEPDVHFVGGNLRDSAGKSNFTKDGPGTLRQGFYSSLGGTNLIRQGVLEAIGTDPLGHTAVSDGAVLRIIGTGTDFPIIGFGLTLNGSGDGKGGLQVEGNSSGWRGPVHFASHSTIAIYGSTNVFIIGATNGQLTGLGGFTKVGDGTLRLTNALASTFAGTTFVNAGRLELGNLPGATAIPGTLIIGNGSGGAAADVVELLRSNQIANASAVTINSSGLLKLGNTVLEDIGPLTLSGGQVEAPFGSGELGLLADVTAQASAQTATLSGNLRFVGSRTFTVADGAAHPDVHFLGGNLRDAASNANFIKDGAGTLRQGYFSSLQGTNIIRAGVLEAIGTDPLGHTVVSNQAVLRVLGTGADFPIIGFTLTLSGQGDGNGALQLTNGSSGWRGPVHFATAASSIGIFGSNNVFTIGATNGQLTGPGGFVKVGDGTLRLTNALGSTYAGITGVLNGRLELGNTPGSNAIPGTLFINEEQPGILAAVKLLADNQIANGATISLYNGFFHLDAFAESIGDLNGLGTITSSVGGALTVTPASGNTTIFDGSFTGAGSLIKAGGGRLRLTGANTLTGPTAVIAGILQVDGLHTNSPVTLSGNSRLEGNGRVGSVALSSANAVLTAGASPGILTCGNLNPSGSGSGIVGFELNGTTPGSGHDQLDVRGTVNLTGLTLQGTLGFASSLSNQFVLIRNDGADPVVGNFNGLPSGNSLSLGGESFRISYTGGDGNDVVLTQTTGSFRPRLTIQRISPTAVRLLWPTNQAAGFSLQTQTNLANSPWLAATPAPVVVGTNHVVTNSVSGRQSYYRLLKP
jgi:autotransporter-associated beta strand protein